MSGEGFTPNTKFTVSYLGFLLTTGTTTDVGTISAEIVVPFTALRGTTNAVEVRDQIGLSAFTGHVVPRAEITLSPSEALAGETITINGVGFPTRFPPSSITFSSFPSVQLPTISSAPTTDRFGNIIVEVQVPWPDRSGVITLEVGDIQAQAPILMKPATIEATRQGINTILVVGAGFPPNAQVNVYVDLIVKSGPNIFTDGAGNVSFEITTIDDITTQEGTVSVNVGEFKASAEIN